MKTAVQGLGQKLIVGVVVGFGLVLAPMAGMAQIACTPQTQSQLLTSFSDNAAKSSITPQTMRNLVCSALPQPYTVASLPTCSASTKNTWAVVTDANSPTYNGALTGGSTTIVPVFCNGSAWTSH